MVMVLSLIINMEVKMKKCVKRALAGILSGTLLFSSVELTSVMNTKFVAATINDKSLENFMDEVSSLYEENDLSNMSPDITFSKESENTVVIDNTIMVPVEILTDNTDISYSDIKEDIVEQDNEQLVAVEDVVKNTDYKAIKNNDDSITLSKIYQSKTLIVKSSVQIDTYNAENVISGYGNLYILKYATEEDTKNAYDKLLKNRNIDSVEIDSLICAETLENFIEEVTEISTEKTTEESISETNESIDNTDIMESSDDIAVDKEETTETSSETESSEELSSESTEESTTEQDAETIIPDGIIVAILDSGIDKDNFLFDGRIVDLGLNLSTSGDGIQDDNGHGTAVASIVAKNSDAYLMPIKIANSDGKGTVLSLYLAIQTAIENEADIINVSLTTTSSDLLTSVIKEATEKGIKVVAAAGNQSANVKNYAPANIDNVITVAATDEEYRPAPYSNYGNLVNYSALGTLFSEEDSFKGTSISAAYVTGVIAKILCENENANVTEELSKYVYDFGEEGKDDYYGNGVVSLEEITAPEETEDDEIFIPEDTPEDGINLEAATTINGVVYTYSSNTLTLTGSGTVTNEWQSYNTTWLGYVTSVKTININSDTLTGIDANAFEGCTKLATAIFTKYNNGVINTDAFANISALNTVIIGNEITSINSSAFSECTSLNTLTIGTGVTYIEKNAFLNAPLATKITFNATSLTENNNVFNNKETANLVIGTGVTKLSDNIFKGMSKITAVTIPSKCTVIGDSAFEDCSALTKITFASGSKCVEIGDNAFMNCIELNNVINNGTNYCLPPSVLTMGDYAFCNTALKAIDTNIALTSIGKMVFGNCTSLNSVTIGTGVTSIEADAFLNAPLATKITYNAKNLTEHNNVFNNRPAISISIGSAVTGIPDNLFKGCSVVREITIPAKVTYIGKEAFSGCFSLYKVSFASGSTLTSIGNNAFYDCTSLNTMSLPGSLIEIGDYAFYNANLSSVTIPKKVTTVGTYAYANNTSLRTLDVGVAVTFIGEKAFNNAPLSSRITYRPTSSNVVHNNVFQGKRTSAISITGGVVEMPDGLFKNCSMVKEVVVPSSLLRIGNNTFEGCTSLVNFTMVNTPKLQTIGDYAFSGCTALVNVRIRSSSTDADGNTTYSYGNRRLPNSVISIGSYAFNNTAMSSIQIGTSTSSLCTEIGNAAFHNCNKLFSVKIFNRNCGIYNETKTISDKAIIIYYPNGTYTGGKSEYVSIEQYLKNFSSKTGIDVSLSSAAKGTWGTKGSWNISFDANGIGTLTLTASANEAIPNYPDGTAPWYKYRDVIDVVNANNGKITGIGDYAFYDFENLTKVTLPSSVTTIGNYAFAECFSLTNIIASSTANTIGNTVTEIGDYAFKNCGEIHILKLGTSTSSKMTSIGKGAFEGCSNITNLYFYSKTVNIPREASFTDDTAILYVYYDSTADQYAKTYNKPHIYLDSNSTGGTTANQSKGTDGNISWYVNNAGVLYINPLISKTNSAMPDYSVGTAPWYPYRNIIKQINISPYITHIGNYSFTGLTNVVKTYFVGGSTINCESIGKGAFQGCNQLTTLYYRSGTDDAGNATYTSYALPKKLTSIDDYAFYDCDKLVKLNLNTGVTTVECNAFRTSNEDENNNVGLQELTINSNISNHNGAFKELKSLKKITLGTGVTEIYDNMFQNNENLATVAVSSTKITKVGTQAFCGCAKLNTTSAFSYTNLGKTLTDVGKYAFRFGGMYEGKEADAPEVEISQSVVKATEFYYPNAIDKKEDASVGLAKVILDVKAESTKTEEGQDYIFILDVTGSMAEKHNGQTQMDTAKEAITYFAEDVISDNPENRVAIVTFDGSTYCLLDFSSDLMQIKNRVSKIGTNGGNTAGYNLGATGGGTDYYSGIIAAEKVMQLRGSDVTLESNGYTLGGTGGANKNTYAIFISDGEPNANEPYIDNVSNLLRGTCDEVWSIGICCTEAKQSTKYLEMINSKSGYFKDFPSINILKAFQDFLSEVKLLSNSAVSDATLSSYINTDCWEPYSDKDYAWSEGLTLSDDKSYVYIDLGEKASNADVRVYSDENQYVFYLKLKDSYKNGLTAYYNGFTDDNSSKPVTMESISYKIYGGLKDGNNGAKSVTNTTALEWNTRSLIIDVGKGTIPSGTETVISRTYGTQYTLPAPMAPSGYTFKGWTLSRDTSKTEAVTDDIGVLSNDTYTFGLTSAVVVATYELDSIDIPVTITWVDKDNEYDSRPSKVTLRLMNGTEIVKEAKVVSGDNSSPANSNTWTYKFEGVDKCDSDGKEIQYTIVEGAYGEDGTFAKDVVPSLFSPVEYKTPAYGGNNSGLTIENNMTNKTLPEDDPTKDYGVTISGTVTWKDENNKYHFRPDSVIVELYQNGKLYGSIEIPEGTTDYKFTGLPMMDNSFKKYTYTIKEKNIDNYTISCESNSKTTTVEDDFGNTVTTTTYTVDITNTFTPDKETERFSDNQLTLQATFLNENGNAATESDFRKVQLDKEDVNTTIVLKQLNLSWKPVNAEEGKYTETYSGYSGNEINLILHGTDKTYVNYIPYGKYEIMVEKNSNFSLESIEELDSNNVQFTYENGKYYITYSYEYEEAKEDLNVNMTLKSWRGYTSKMGISNFFKN